MDPKLVQQVIDALVAGDGAAALKLLQALLTQAAGGEASPTDAAGTDPTAPPADPAAAAAMSLLGEITGKKAPGEIVAAVRALSIAQQKAAADQAALDRTSRIELVGQLVKLRAELPATAWEGDPKDLKPCERLGKEPIDSLRARVAALSATGPAFHNADPSTSNLTADEEKATANFTPAQRERYVALRLSRLNRRAS